jgi:hypothetical protein
MVNCFVLKKQISIQYFKRYRNAQSLYQLTVIETFFQQLSKLPKCLAEAVVIAHAI